MQSSHIEKAIPEVVQSTTVQFRHLYHLLGYFGLLTVHTILTIVAFMGAPIVSAVAFALMWAAIIFYLLVVRPSRVLFAFIFLLPIYQWVLVTLLHVTGSTTLISIVQPWKELLIFGTLILIGGHYLLTARRIKVRAMDLLMIGYSGINFLYLILPFDTSFSTRLYGFRSMIILVLLYSLGRLIPLSPLRQKQVIDVFLILGVAVGVFALIDRFLLPIDWPARLGFYEYLAKDSFDGSIGFIGPMNMPWTFWTSAGIRRTSSFFANPLDVAASVHLLGVTALVATLVTRRYTYWNLIATIAFGFTLIALLLSISRASIVTFALECMLIAFLLRRYQMLMLIILTVTLGFIASLFTPIGTFIIETITLQNPSLLGHFDSWQAGFLALLENPGGYGPGTSGHAGAVSGMQIGGENQYVITGVQLGVVGLFFYILLQISAINTSIRLFRRSTGTTRALALITGVSRFGLAIIAFTANTEIYLFSAYVSWWLVGWVHQIHKTQVPTTPATDLSPSDLKPNPAT